MRFRALPAIFAAAALVAPAFAAQLGSTAQSVLPSTTRQIVSVNYHRLTASPLALSVEGQVLPDQMRNVQHLLAEGGINVQQNLSRLTFATYANGKTIGLIGIAEGDFDGFQTSHFFHPTAHYPNPPQYEGVTYYNTGSLDFYLPDPTTFVFGDYQSIKTAIETQSGAQPSLDQNSQLTDLIAGTESSDVWSVLDAAGAQGLIGSLASGASTFNASVLASHFQGARYTIDFSNDVKVNLELMTDDPVSAGLASTGLRAAVLYKEYRAKNPALKNLLNEVEVDSAGNDAFLQVETPQSQVADLLHTQLFQSILR